VGVLNVQRCNESANETLTQLYFQCIRGADITHKFREILDTISLNKVFAIQYFRLIAQTRDIHGGKGEWSLAYTMLWEWYRHYPDMVLECLPFFFNSLPHAKSKPYGSWKDAKYLCNYIKNRVETPLHHPLIRKCVQLMNEQLKRDLEILDTLSEEPAYSLVAKWIPRENSAFGWLYDALVADFFNTSIQEITTNNRAKYRKIIATMNRLLDTVQIKQCSKIWCNIEHHKTTATTMLKQRSAFLNKKFDETGTSYIERTDDPDRIQCARNLEAFLDKLREKKQNVKGKVLGLEQMTKSAIAINRLHRQGYDVATEKEILDSQWRNNAMKNGTLESMVAMVDLSHSMDGNPYLAAIALGCRVAEKSTFGRRILTFAARPEWIDLTETETFTEMVDKITMNTADIGYNTDFYAALDKILDEYDPERPVRTLVIFSDMQIDTNLAMMIDGEPAVSSECLEEVEILAAQWTSMSEEIRERYRATGIAKYGEPLEPPHILFWNLRQTRGFPTLTEKFQGTSMISGFDPSALQVFCEFGIDGLRKFIGQGLVQHILGNARYLPMENIARDHFDKIQDPKKEDETISSEDFVIYEINLYQNIALVGGLFVFLGFIFAAHIFMSLLWEIY
jgi:hypothetical protein